MTRLTFKKNERLTNKKTFEQLFNTGKSFTVAPFRLVWVETKANGTIPVQLGISVPKRSFAKAVDRNVLKRKIREAYRKNKHLLYGVLQKENLSIALMIIYIAKEEVPYREIENKMIVSLQRLAAQKHP
jgi:ribonuclease P protein component